MVSSFYLHILVLLCNLFSFIQSQSSSSAVLDFQGETGWPDACKGNRQTPINFPDYSKSNNTYVALNNTKILSNSYKEISGISIYQSVSSGKFAFNKSDMGQLFFQKNGLMYRYDLIEIHFHSKAEHVFNGTQYDLEMHLVHTKNNTEFNSTYKNQTDPDGQQQLLVVGIIFQINDNKGNLNSNTNNTFIQKLKLWNSSAIVDNFTLNEFALESKFYFHYEGGLTTPGCDETVNWIVMTQIENMTMTQLGEFNTLLKAKGYMNGNTRGTKPLNGRKIYYSDTPTFNAMVQKAISNGWFYTIGLALGLVSLIFV